MPVSRKDLMGLSVFFLTAVTAAFLGFMPHFVETTHALSLSVATWIVLGLVALSVICYLVQQSDIRNEDYQRQVRQVAREGDQEAREKRRDQLLAQFAETLKGKGNFESPFVGDIDRAIKNYNLANKSTPQPIPLFEPGALSQLFDLTKEYWARQGSSQKPGPKYLPNDPRSKTIPSGGPDYYRLSKKGSTEASANKIENTLLTAKMPLPPFIPSVSDTLRDESDSILQKFLKDIEKYRKGPNQT
jgi:hypothetical protein